MVSVPVRLERSDAPRTGRRRRPGAPSPVVGAPTGTRRWWPTTSTVAGAGFALWGLTVGLQPLHDNSFLTHLATGRLIWDGGGIPRADPYSFTARGAPWVVQSWLASAMYGGVERVGGLGGVRLVNGLLVALLAALVWRLARPAVELPGRLVVTGLAVAVGTGLWVERPLLFGLLGMALLLLVAEGGLHPAWLVPGMWVWVNTHGSFPLAVVALGALAAGRRLDGERPDRELRALGWTMVGIAAAALNPLGPRLLAFPLELLRRTDSFRTIVEWRPPTFDDPWQLLFLAQLLVAVVVLVRRPRWRRALPLAVFAALALLGARNVVTASLVLVPTMAEGLRGLGTVTGERRSRATLAATATAALVAVALVATSLAGPDTVLTAYPVRAVAWLDAKGLLDDHVIAPDYVGNYLEARDGARAEVFVDDRVDMYPEQVVADAAALLEGRPGWRARLERYDAGVVLWPRDEPLTTILSASSQWRRVWGDDQWVVFVPT